MLSEQQARSFAQANGQINIWDGAIRAGKTVSSLLRWARYVSSDGPRGGGVLVVTGKTHDTIKRNVFATLMDPAIMGRAARLTAYTTGAPTGVIMGQEVQVISGNDAGSEERLRGLTARGWYADEMGILPEAFVDQLVGRASHPMAKGFGTTNPGAPNHWFKRRYLDRAWQATGPDIRTWRFTLDDNPTLTEEYKNLIKGLYSGVWYKRMILGLWAVAEGAVFGGWEPETMVVDRIPKITRWLAVGIDYGTTNPFSAILVGLSPGERDQPTRLYVVGEWRHDSRAAGRQLSDRQYSDAVRGWLDGFVIPNDEGPLAPAVVKGIRPEYVLVDPSAASFRVQLHRDGLANYPGDNSVTDGLRTMASLIAADRLRVHRSCTGLIGELPGYAWDAKAAQRGEDAPVKVDDHSVDAARYAIRTTEPLWHGQVFARALER